jgi:hypothetical protein
LVVSGFNQRERKREKKSNDKNHKGKYIDDDGGKK